MDLLVETKLPNGRMKAMSFLAFKNQKDIEKFLKRKFILELE